MSQFDFLTNELKNFSDKKTKNSLSSLDFFSKNEVKKSNSGYARKAKSIKQTTEYKVKLQKNKRSKSSVPKTESIINDAISELTTFHFVSTSTFESVINSYGMSLVNDITNSINANVQTKIDTIQNLPQNIIDGLWADAATQINSAISQVQAMVNSIVGNQVAALNKELSKYTGQFKAMTSLLNKKIPSVDINLLTGKITNFDFTKRSKGNSSVSRYIQANIPTKAGKLLPNASVLTETPDAKILMSKLKVDTNIVKNFASLTLPKLPALPSLDSLIPKVPELPAMPSLPSLPTLPTLPQLSSLVNFSALGAKLGFSPGLIPTELKKKIEEPKPTANKAEYGKIRVKESKGGCVEIIDDTPGNVRKINQHPSGSYNSMLDDGSVHTKATGNKQEIVDGEWNVKVEKDAVIIVAGNEKIEIRKDCKETIGGNRTTHISGEQSILALKTVSLDYKDNFEEKIGGDNTSSVAGDRKQKTGGKLEETITGDHKETTNGSLTIKVIGNVNISSCGNTTVKSTGPATLSSDQEVRISAPRVNIG